MVSGALLLFALVLGYVYRFGYGYNGLTGEQAVLFMLLAVGAVALGGLPKAVAGASRSGYWWRWPLHCCCCWRWGGTNLTGG